MRSYHFVFLIVSFSLMACRQVQEHGFPIPDELAFLPADSNPGCEKPVAPGIVFQSIDGGQTWEDISSGLPVDLNAQQIFAANGDLYLSGGNGVYSSTTSSGTLAWKKENYLITQSPIISAGLRGVFACNFEGGFFQKLHGTDIWLPMFTDFKEHTPRNIFEAGDGAIFIGCDSGLFKSTDRGATWRHVMEGGWVIHLVESDGILLCTSQKGILRSTDGGEHWDEVISEGGVGIAVEIIEGGFAAITYNTESETRRVRTSTDGGKTWSPIDTGLPPSMLISSIKQAGKYFLCGHPDGIFRSADQGKTWELVKSAIGKKVFNLTVSGKVIYAVAMDGGC